MNMIKKFEDKKLKLNSLNTHIPSNMCNMNPVYVRFSITYRKWEKNNNKSSFYYNLS